VIDERDAAIAALRAAGPVRPAGAHAAPVQPDEDTDHEGIPVAREESAGA
jgi:hypothetical protein